MKKKILEIFMWGICIAALAVMSTVTVREYQKMKNSLEAIQQQTEGIAAQAEELNTANADLEKRIAELEREQEERKNSENIEKETMENQEQNETAEGQITQSGLSGITDLEVGSIVDASQISWSNLDSYFQAYEIVEGDAVYNRIIEKSYRENNDIGLADLRYLKVLHYNFDGNVQVGEVIVNAQLADDFISAFKSLYEERYEIQSMYLIDNYWTGDGATSDNACN